MKRNASVEMRQERMEKGRKRKNLEKRQRVRRRIKFKKRNWWRGVRERQRHFMSKEKEKRKSRYG